MDKPSPPPPPAHGSTGHPEWQGEQTGQAETCEDQSSSGHVSGRSASSIAGSSQTSLPQREDTDRHRILRQRSLLSYRIGRSQAEREKPTTSHLLEVAGSDCFKVAPDIFDGTGIIDYFSLMHASKRINIQKRVIASESRIPGAGQGCFTMKAYAKRELIGLYPGKLVRKKNMPEQWNKSYKTHFDLTENQIAYPVMAIWSGNGSNTRFHTEADTYIAWSGVKVYRQGEELGIDGSDASNPLAYLNHSDKPNVILISVIHPDFLQRITPDGTQYIVPEGVNSDHMLLAAVCLEPVEKDQELVFRYGNNPCFEKIGFDVHKAPQDCMQFQNGRLKFLPPQQWQDQAFAKLSGFAIPTPSTDIIMSDSDDDQSASLPRKHKRPGQLESYPPHLEPDSASEETDEEQTDLPRVRLKPLPKKAKPMISSSSDTSESEAEESMALEYAEPASKKISRKPRTTYDRKMFFSKTRKLLKPGQIETARKKPEQLMDVVKLFWQPDLEKSLTVLANHLNALGLENWNGDWWDNSSVFYLLSETDCLSDQQFYELMPFAVLKELYNKPDLYPDILPGFIQAWFDSGKPSATLFSKFTRYNISPPPQTQSQTWSTSLIHQVCPELSAEQQIESLTKSPHYQKKYSKTLSKLLTTIRQEGQEGLAALKTYISLNLNERNIKLNDLCIMLRHSNITIPDTCRTNWQAADVTLLQKKWGMLDTNDNNALFDIPIKAFTQLQLSEEKVAAYVKNWIETGQNIEALDRNNLKLTQAGNKYALAQLLLNHFQTGVTFKNTIKSLSDSYREAYQKNKTAKMRAVAVELLFRSQLNEDQAFEAFLDCMQLNGQTDNFIARRLRSTGWPIPGRYNTADGPSGTCLWKPSNLRVARKEAEAPSSSRPRKKSQ